MGTTDKDEILFLLLLVVSGAFALVLMCIFENFREYIFATWGLFISVLILRIIYKNHFDDAGWQK